MYIDGHAITKEEVDATDKRLEEEREAKFRKERGRNLIFSFVMILILVGLTLAGIHFLP